MSSTVRRLTAELSLVVAAVALIAASAQVAIPLPFTPVPLTGQTFAVLLVGSSYGLARALASVAVYVAIGALGAPIFADGAHGVAVIQSATGGYLIGMILAAAATGLAADKSWVRRPIGAVSAMVVGNAVIYAVGVTWLRASLDLSWSTAASLGLTPFLVGDAVKILLAGLSLPMAWRFVRRARR